VGRDSVFRIPLRELLRKGGSFDFVLGTNTGSLKQALSS
jgi:hypothetical protein